MRSQLQSFGDALANLLQPDNFLQLALIGGALLLGWWAAVHARSRITVAPEPENLPDRLRELLFIGAPPALTLVILAQPTDCCTQRDCRPTWSGRHRTEGYGGNERDRDRN